MKLTQITAVLSIFTGVLLAADAPSISLIHDRNGRSVVIAGDVVDIFGSNLADGVVSQSGWPLPLTVNSVSVTCSGYSAPILTAGPGVVRIQLPWELAGLNGADIQVIRGGVSSAPFHVSMSEVAPSILSMDSTSVTPGQTLTLRAIGLGPRIANPPTGLAPTAQAPGGVLLSSLVLMGGVPAPITSTALVQSNDVQNDAGVETIAVQVPWNVPAGDGIQVEIQIGSITSAALPVSVQTPDVQVSLSPSAVNVPLGTYFRFQSLVQGSADSSLTWSVDPSNYSLPNTPNAIGDFSSGLFRANYDLPPQSWGVIRATHSSGAFATALIQIVASDGNSYRIVPDSPVIGAGETISFQLLGTDGSPVSNATWNISDGFSSVSQPTYTAPTSFPPSQVIVRARLPGQGVLSIYMYDAASTIIHIDPARVYLSGISPAAAHVGEIVTFQGLNIPPGNTYAWFTAADGSQIRSPGSGAMFTVPHGAVTGPVRMETAINGGSTFLSASLPIVVLPRLRLRPSRLKVSSGETIPIIATTPDVAGTWQVNWRADAGSIDAKGNFLAPMVYGTTYARIWGCLQQNLECGTTIVEVDALRLEPDPTVVSPGEQISLEAWQGASPVSATWTAMTSNITVTADGKLTAGSGPFDGGPAVVSANTGSFTQYLMLTVRGAGAVANTVEYYDWLGPSNNSPNGRLPLGVFVGSTAVHGDWIYTLANSIPGYYGGPWQSTWLDVYKLDARRRPVWVDSIEAPDDPRGTLTIQGNTLYLMGGENSPLQSPVPYTLLTYDVTGGRPVLLSRGAFSGTPPSYTHEGLAFNVTPNPGFAGPQIMLQIANFASGGTRNLVLDYQPLYDFYDATVSGTNGWAAITFFYPFSSGANYETVVVDTTTDTAEPFAIVASGGFNYSVTAFPNVLVVGGDVYTVSGHDVNLASHIPITFAADSDPATNRILGVPIDYIQQDGYRVVDLTDPANPKISAPTVASEQTVTAVLGSDYFVLGGTPQNLTVYPISWSGGPLLTDTFPASPAMNDLAVRDNYLYWTGYGFGTQGRSVSRDLFEVVDLSTTPSTVVATLDRPLDEVGWAIQLNGSYAYVGTDTELIVYDIHSPRRPVQTLVIPAPAISLALNGNYLYAGSNSGSSKTLLVYDVSNPAAPRLLSSTPLTDFAYAVAAQPGWLAVGLGTGGFSLYSLANPAAPVLASHTQLWTWGAVGVKNLLYLAGDFVGLAIFDVTNLANPTELSQTPLAAGDESGDFFPEALSISLDQRGIAWLTTPKDGRVYGLDVRQPAWPHHIAEFALGLGVGSYSNATASANNHLIVAGMDADFDTTNPENVGLYLVQQTTPGQVQPDRYSDKPPFDPSAQAANTRSPKARALNHIDSSRRVRPPAAPSATLPKPPL